MPPRKQARPRVVRHAPDYRDQPADAQYTHDRAWMPELVLVAKNTHVWLDQLSRKYAQPMRTPADVPDEELDMLAGRGITGLWLIGIWERSPASRRLKQMLGQPDAAASAYSIYDYEIAAGLGGDEAASDLQRRALERGIRLSADMVPNHMGIDSRWVAEHPEWFITLDEPPFASYTFTHENLSEDTRVEIYLEDHYYDQTATAVVFKRVDTRTRETKYIYHGNDGTSFAWNDTAQLDYSRAEVRAAVADTILKVASRFPIIRFDAAMTLAREHIHRLWFPDRSRSDSIPSRFGHGMTQAEFDAAVPNEFWREVVDRAAVEAPDTLMMAEAFWMMEGYFVRTLGMHRVYNSAFMHMLRDEETGKYRQLIKNTLEFDPPILQRHVNFMSNPDEETAIDQFGTGDRYFGVCAVMATLPGLPMFAHGQMDGLRERYGMEYLRAKMDEQPDAAVVKRHEELIYPLLRERALFAQVEEFELFDLAGRLGKVNESVLAYTNRRGDARALVVFHNAKGNATGRLQKGAKVLDRSTGQARERSLAEALGLPKTGYAIARDRVSGLEYVRECAALWDKGLRVQLGPYGCAVWMDWRFVEGAEWDAVFARVGEAGAASVDELRVPEVGE